MIGIIFSFLAFVSLACARPTASFAYERNGSVFLHLPGQPSIVLTRGARDYEPRLSPAGDMVAFCREIGDGAHAARKLWAVSVVTPFVERLLVGRAVQYKQFYLTGCEKPDFSVDGKLIFFLMPFSDTSGVLARLNLESGEVTTIGDAIDYRVIRQGKYAGNIVALKRKHTLVGVWTWYWLIDTNGQELGAIGDRSALTEFENQYEAKSPR